MSYLQFIQQGEAESMVSGDGVSMNAPYLQFIQQGEAESMVSGNGVSMNVSYLQCLDEIYGETVRVGRGERHALADLNYILGFNPNNINHERCHSTDGVTQIYWASTQTTTWISIAFLSSKPPSLLSSKPPSL
jgi:hypothetical protein